MRVHVQHVPVEGLWGIDAWLRHRGAVVTTTRFFESAVRIERKPSLAKDRPAGRN